jgi:hypothetical protein
MSMESAQAEITIATFPAFTDRRQVSSGGGVQPLWRRDGKELFFLGRDQMLRAADISTTAGLKVGEIRALFQTSVRADGQRFLLREPANRENSVAEQLQIVTNWTSLVRR